MNNIGKDGNKADRTLGEYWEDVFIEMVKAWGWEAWPFTRVRGPRFEYNGKMYTSPDVWVLRRGVKQYVCELKHKNLARNSCYGFEEYREASMLAIENDYKNQFGRVIALYVVHNHDMAGGKFKKENSIAHWHAGMMTELVKNHISGKPQRTYYNGALSEKPVAIHYYPYRLFKPIEHFFAFDIGT